MTSLPSTGTVCRARLRADNAIRMHMMRGFAVPNFRSLDRRAFAERKHAKRVQIWIRRKSWPVDFWPALLAPPLVGLLVPSWCGGRPG